MRHRPERSMAEHPVGGSAGSREPGRVALARPHPDGVPVVEDLDAVGLAIEERVDELWRRAGVVAAEHTEPRPDGREAREYLRACERVASVVERCSDGRTAEEHEVVARFADAEGEDLADRRLTEHVVERVVAPVVEQSRDPCPHEMHVHGERRRGRRPGERRLFASDLTEAESRPAELDRRERGEISGGSELANVVVGEGVVSVVGVGTAPDAVEQRLGEDRHPTSIARWRAGRAARMVP
jgi:hypothetical protein